MNASYKSKELRKTFHEDIDKYFDTIDERIESFSKTNLESVTDQCQDMMVKMKSCVDMTTSVDALVAAENDSKMLALGEQFLSQAEELLQLLAGPSIDAVEIPQLRLERGQDWSLKGAVDLQLRRVQRSVRVVSNRHAFPILPRKLKQ